MTSTAQYKARVPRDLKNASRFSFSRLEVKKPGGKKKRVMRWRRDTPFALEGRTKFPHSVRLATPDVHVLKDGHNQSKIGRYITIGKWAGFQIYTLTLEERATCPRSCKQWDRCYGNNMQYAHRFRSGKTLEAAIERDLTELQRVHPRGFAVRLHILGDFYSEEYVELWRKWLCQFPALHVFGFTARNLKCKIGQKLFMLKSERWDRFAIRFSGRLSDTDSSLTVEKAPEFIASLPFKAFHCPAQTGKVWGCGRCGACWNTHVPVVFEYH